MPFAAALSEHPLTTHAVGEVVGTVLERLGPDPDLAVVFVTGPHAGALEDVVAAVRVLLGAGVTLAAAAGSVLGGRRQVERRAAVGLWAARFVPAGVRKGYYPAPGANEDALIMWATDIDTPEYRARLLEIERALPTPTLREAT